MVDQQGIGADLEFVALLQHHAIPGGHGPVVVPDGIGIAHIEDAPAIRAAADLGLQARNPTLRIRQRQGVGIRAPDGAAALIEVGGNRLRQGLSSQADGADEQMHMKKAPEGPRIGVGIGDGAGVGSALMHRGTLPCILSGARRAVNQRKSCGRAAVCVHPLRPPVNAGAQRFRFSHHLADTATTTPARPRRWPPRSAGS